MRRASPPVGFLSRTAAGVFAAVAALRDPSRADMVAIVGETTGACALASIRRKMLLDPTGRRILRERPTITAQSLNIAHLRSLPTTTFGYAYTHFMDSHAFSPDERPPVTHIGAETITASNSSSNHADADELAYVMLRYRQIHDFWHTLLDMPITVESEIAVKAFEFAQTGLPLGLLSTLGGPLRLTPTERSRLFYVYIPWMMQCAANSSFLMNVMYEDMLDVDVDVVRDRLGFLPRPPAVDQALAEAQAEADAMDTHVDPVGTLDLAAETHNLGLQQQPKGAFV